MKPANLRANPLGRASKYNENTPVDAYILARGGMNDAQVAKTLGVEQATLIYWREKHPAFAYALNKARETEVGTGRATFRDYIYGQLTPELRELWDEIDMWFDHSDGRTRIESLLSSRSVRVRQSLWMHAMVQCNFNASEACRRVCINKSTLNEWADTDPDFPKLLDELNWHKKNFFEGGLVSLVAEGNVLATVFANKTQNRDRGYSEKLTVEHTGTVHHLHQHVVKIDSLHLSLDTRREILKGMRSLKTAEGTDRTLPASEQQRTAIPLSLLQDDADE